jgi:putative Mn2+ efflux pump MntP
LEIYNKSTFVIGIIFTVFGSIMTIIGTAILWRDISIESESITFGILVIVGGTITIGRSMISVLQESGKI